MTAIWSPARALLSTAEHFRVLCSDGWCVLLSTYRFLVALIFWWEFHNKALFFVDVRMYFTSPVSWICTWSSCLFDFYILVSLFKSCILNLIFFNLLLLPSYLLPLCGLRIILTESRIHAERNIPIKSHLGWGEWAIILRSLNVSTKI